MMKVTFIYLINKENAGYVTHYVVPNVNVTVSVIVPI
jgi:hypothetical protein